ncbi:prolyl oligopeptidase family serine peptidase [Nocardiopsis sp. YSL2]|uniref:prolyl oligopeptidase family serine peptidase n=1 Tax=Nocardiopsis sp. YSL2 TaxID=2939492 RepID=UPI0026F41EED|nr:prolyl oligopeptidase family serine peptidase [Nocardiopsis sp. YSL2]
MVRNRAPGAALAHDPASVLDTLHGRAVPDPYRWLETADSPATVNWIEERGREYEREAATWPLRGRLAERIRALVDTDLWTPPVLRPGRVFTTLRPAGAEHPRLVVFDDDGQGPPRTVFDPAEDDPSGRTTLDAWEPDPDGRLVALQTSSGGVERGGLRVLRTDSGAQVGPAVHGVRYSHVAWLPGDGPAFCYVRRDGARGVRGVWLRRVADGAETLVHACTAPDTVPGVRVLGGRWLLVTESHGTGHRTDLWLAGLGERPSRTRGPRLNAVQVGEEGETEARLGTDGLLYLRTTLRAPHRRICAVSPHEPGVEHWREVVAEDPGATLDAFTPCSGPDGPALFVARTRLGISEAVVHDARTGARLYAVDLPGEGMVSAPEAAPDGTVHFGYADVAAQQRVLSLAPGDPVPRPWPALPPPTEAAGRPGHAGADTTAHASDEPSGAGGRDEAGHAPSVRRTVHWCRSQDGTRVPISVFTLRERPCPEDAPEPPPAPGPTILHAYGGFGRPRQFGFSATVLAWLQAGGRYAVAHVRGGGDAGRDWHLRGSGRDKPRAVQDLVAAADALVDADVCARHQLCLSGGSAGGLLVLAAATARPDLCEAVIASAPLADMARFEQLGLGRMWTREFGTAADPDDFAVLMSYSPYHRVLDRAVHSPGHRYPSILLTGFAGDTRTGAAHPRKMCAALLAAARHEGRPPVLLRYERDVGHGPRAVSRAVGLAADAHAFAAQRTGLLPR